MVSKYSLPFIMLKKALTMVALLFIVPTLTYAFVIKTFLDEKDFPAWSKEAINNMARLGLMNGYEDNSFKPSNYVTRAELAQILNRSEDLKISQLEKYSFMKAALAKIDTTEEVKMTIALAAADFKLLENKPDLNSSDCVTKPLFEANGYNIYKCSILTDLYYVHYNYAGGFPESGTSQIMVVDKWFGPFYPQTYNYGFFDVTAEGEFSKK